MDSTKTKASPNKNTLLQKKVAKILQHDLENDKETVESLRSLSLLVKDNTPDERRMMRSSIESQSLAINSEFLSSFTRIKQQLDHIHSNAATMRDTCAALLSHVRAAKEKDQEILSTLQRLRESEIDPLALTSEEEQSLNGDAGSDGFLTALARLQEIHSDAKSILMTSDASENTSALQAMERTAVMREAAMEKLFRWCLSCLRTTAGHESHEPQTALIAKSLHVLDREKPDLLDHCLEEYGTVRRLAVVRNFIDALTMSKSAGRSADPGTRAIDSYMNDAVRFVSDIFSWLMDMMVKEETAIEAILSLCTNCDKGLRAAYFLTFVCEGLCPPIRTRFEGVILMDEKYPQRRNYAPLVLFNVKCVISFHVQALAGKLMKESLLLFTLLDMAQLAEKMFDNTLSYHLSEIGKQGFELTEGLKPDDNFAHAVRLVHQVISFCNKNPDLAPKQEMYEIVAKFMDAFLFYFANLNECLLGPEGRVFLLNCLDALTYVIGGLDGLGESLDQLQKMMEETIHAVTGEQVSFMIQFLGLRTIHNRIIDNDTSAPLSSVPGCDAVTLSNAAESLDQFLAAPEIVTMPSVGRITNQMIRDQVWRESRVLFLSIYTSVYESVSDPDQGYEDVKTLLVRQPDQVKSLLL